jgi:crotonobetainyl-CoA:carnitine CoA-transferase CaiB-like acyl-CoA transferase
MTAIATSSADAAAHTAAPLRIVDFSTHLSGPMASHLLAELGADVIKIERPVIGDGNRGDHPRINGVGMFHVACSSGVRSLAINSRSPHWSSVVDAAARWADAVIVGARPVDAMKRGLDFASLRGVNPRLVYCLISGYGETGKWKDYSAHGQSIDALAGMVDVEWRDGMPQTRQGWRSAGSTLAGVFGAMGVLDGIIRRDRTGTAQHVSVSLWQSALWWNWRDVTCLANLDHRWNEYEALGSRYAMYPTSDERAILVAPIEQKFWHEFCDLLELPDEWRDRGDWSESGMDFGKGLADERDHIASITRTRTLREWWAAFAGTDIPWAPVLTPGEAIESDHATAEGAMRRTRVGDQAVRVVATPVRFADDATVGAPGREKELTELSAPPAVGEQTAEVISMLGLDLSPESLTLPGS